MNPVGAASNSGPRFLHPVFYFSYYFDLSCDFSRNVFFYYHSGADYAMMFL